MNRALPMLATTALLLTGCPPDGTRPGVPLEVTRISMSNWSQLGGPLRTAVFDADKFADLWTQLFGAGIPVPAVDFEREFVVVAALGNRGTGGYDVDVTSAERVAGGVVAEVVESRPGKNCLVTMSTTRPIDIVRVRRPVKSPAVLSVRFVERSVVRDCRE